VRAAVKNDSSEFSTIYFPTGGRNIFRRSVLHRNFSPHHFLAKAQGGGRKPSTPPPLELEGGGPAHPLYVPIKPCAPPPPRAEGRRPFFFPGFGGCVGVELLPGVNRTLVHRKGGWGKTRRKRLVRGGTRGWGGGLVGATRWHAGFATPRESLMDQKSNFPRKHNHHAPGKRHHLAGLLPSHTLQRGPQGRPQPSTSSLRTIRGRISLWRPTSPRGPWMQGGRVILFNVQPSE